MTDHTDRHAHRGPHPLLVVAGGLLLVKAAARRCAGRAHRNAATSEDVRA